jgi:hypothetical protein
MRAGTGPAELLTVEKLYNQTANFNAKNRVNEVLAGPYRAGSALAG